MSHYTIGMRTPRGYEWVLAEMVRATPRRYFYMRLLESCSLPGRKRGRAGQVIRVPQMAVHPLRPLSEILP